MGSEKWYYEIKDKETGETAFISAPLPIRQEKLCEFLGLDNFFVCSRTITKQEYDGEIDDNPELLKGGTK